MPGPVFRAGVSIQSAPGASTLPARKPAIKQRREVRVTFARHAQPIETGEGRVLARAGDAILRVGEEECWRVSADKFDHKYAPLAPTEKGNDGTYVSLPIRVMVARMEQDFEVELGDGESRLYGHPGDWLVDYGDGSLGIVGAALFSSIYQMVG